MFSERYVAVAQDGCEFHFSRDGNVRMLTPQSDWILRSNTGAVPRQAVIDAFLNCINGREHDK